jgi:hypothetical protein
MCHLYSHLKRKDHSPTSLIKPNGRRHTAGKYSSKSRKRIQYNITAGAQQHGAIEEEDTKAPKMMRPMI